MMEDLNVQGYGGMAVFDEQNASMMAHAMWKVKA